MKTDMMRYKDPPITEKVRKNSLFGNDTHFAEKRYGVFKKMHKPEIEA